MQLLKKIVLLSTLFITIFCIGSNYYLKDKEKQIETLNAAVNPSEIFYLYDEHYPIYLGSDPNYAYYADYSFTIQIDYVDITDIALLNSINIETIIFARNQNDFNEREIYYDDYVIDLSQSAINIIDKNYIDIYIDYIQTDWDTNSIEIDIDINGIFLEDFVPPNEEVEIDISLMDPFLTLFIQSQFSKAVQEFKFNQGESIGYDNGYSEGESIGYENGYIEGFGDGEKALDFTFLSKIFEQAKSFFDMEMFPGFKLVYLIAGPLIIALIVGVLKFLR